MSSTDLKGARRHRGPGARPRKGMKRKLPDMLRRQRAVEKTKTLFETKVFDLGSADCIKMAKQHLKAMGHDLPTTGHYSTALEARAQLKKHGVRNLEELMDKFLERIPPAAMNLGDVGMPSFSEEEEGTAHDLGTIVIKADAEKFIGWHPDKATLAVMEILSFRAAWRA